MKRLWLCCLLALGCGSDTAGPAQAQWPADGRTPLEGRYSYSFTWSDPVAGSDRYTGTITIDDAAPTTFAISWNSSGYYDPDPVVWTGTAYRTHVHRSGAELTHRFWREAGAEKLSCSGTYRTETASASIQYDASCEVTYLGH